MIAAFGLGLAVLAIPSRLVILSRLAAAAGAGFALATLGGYLLTVWIGLFGFKEVRTAAGIVAGLVEVAAFVVLAALALAPAPADNAAGGAAGRPDSPPRSPRRPPGRPESPPAAWRLRRWCCSGSRWPGPAPTRPPAAATGTVLKTTTIGGTTVLTNAKGFTLYSFAPTRRPGRNATAAVLRTGPR